MQANIPVMRRNFSGGSPTVFRTLTLFLRERAPFSSERASLLGVLARACQ
jgi:hypothetical protein